MNNKIMLKKEDPKTIIFKYLLIVLILGISLYLIIIQPLGPNLFRLPGDLGDSRLNKYILEYNFRRIIGQDKNLWDVPFDYFYPLSLTYSVNHFGSMFIYIIFRSVAYDQEFAFQAWYIFSYILNFSIAVYVLSRLKQKTLAVGFCAFFFTFNLPVLAQEEHVQFAYRFGIPLARFALWKHKMTISSRYSTTI